jgi:transcription antitermination factor NusG
MQKNWFIFYTKSRHEKSAAALLEKNQFEVFLPLQTELRMWSDRNKKVQMPLFRNYLFVKDIPTNIGKVLQVPGIAWNVKHNDHPAFLTQHEVDLIIRFLESGLPVSANATPPDFLAGDRVVVSAGPLKGLTGVLSRTDDQSFLVLVEALNQVMKVQIAPGFLEKKT